MPNQPSGVLVPAYVYPDDGSWDVLRDFGQAMFGRLMVVAAHDNGHFTEEDGNYVASIDAMKAVCATVLGYVHDCYDNTKVSDTCPRTTDIMDDVDRWFSTYQIDGIFVDQLLRDREEHAAEIVQRILSRHGDAIVVLNPGNIPSLDFMEKTHPAIVVIQENTAEEFENPWPPDDGINDPRRWVRARASVEPPAVNSIPARRLAIIAHTIPDPAAVDLLIAKATQYDIGWVYAQDTAGSNYKPFSTHLRLMADRLGPCARLGCINPFGRILCVFANSLLCYILRMNKRLRAAVSRRGLSR